MRVETKDLTFTDGVYKYQGKEIKVGYNKDSSKAGYFWYAFTNHIWWQALLAIVLTLVVTGSTVLVWEAETKKEQEAQAKREKNKTNKK